MRPLLLTHELANFCQWWHRRASVNTALVWRKTQTDDTWLYFFKWRKKKKQWCFQVQTEHSIFCVEVVCVCFGVLKHDELRHRMVFYHASTLNPHAASLQAKGCVSMRHKGPWQIYQSALNMAPLCKSFKQQYVAINTAYLWCGQAVCLSVLVLLFFFKHLLYSSVQWAWTNTQINQVREYLNKYFSIFGKRLSALSQS